MPQNNLIFSDKFNEMSAFVTIYVAYPKIQCTAKKKDSQIYQMYDEVSLQYPIPLPTNVFRYRPSKVLSLGTPSLSTLNLGL